MAEDIHECIKIELEAVHQLLVKTRDELRKAKANPDSDQLSIENLQSQASYFEGQLNAFDRIDDMFNDIKNAPKEIYDPV